MRLGIRLKILLTFVACFGLMAVISLNLLRSSLNKSYDEIERRDLTSHMNRVVQSIEAGLSHLSNLTRDWAVWTEMYNYALKPNAAWAKDNIGTHAMEPADLSLVMVFDGKGKLILQTTRGQGGGRLNLPNLQASAYPDFLKKKRDAPGCGLMQTDVGLMMTCWANIKRSDASGDFVGTVVMGRQLDRQMVVKLSEQIRMPFEFHAKQTLPAGLTRWPGVQSSRSLGAGDFWTFHEENMYHLAYPLQDMLKNNVGLVTFDVSRDVHEEGEKLYGQVSRQWVWMALVMVLLMAIALHFLLVRRLRRFEKQLVTLTEESSWQSRIDVQGSDELGVLSSNVNTLLGMIESDVSKLEILSLTDTLTGLPNRRAFDARLALEYARQQRNKTPLAMLMIDIDHFKKYNDHYGHPAGDAALKATADVLKVAVCRSSDLAARIGGEEFAVLMPETPLQDALKIANRIRSVMKGRDLPHEASPVASYMTFSIGVAVVGDETPESFVNRVDQALYQAKNTGRDRAFCDES